MIYREGLQGFDHYALWCVFSIIQKVCCFFLSYFFMLSVQVGEFLIVVVKKKEFVWVFVLFRYCVDLLCVRLYGFDLEVNFVCYKYSLWIWQILQASDIFFNHPVKFFNNLAVFLGNPSHRLIGSLNTDLIRLLKANYRDKFNRHYSTSFNEK